MANEKYALLDTDFISKMHLIRKDDQNKLIDKIMTMPEYTFYCHKQIGMELARHNIAGASEWFNAKVADQSVILYDDERIINELTKIYGELAVVSYASMLKLACDSYSAGYFEENFARISKVDYFHIRKEEFIKQLEEDCSEIGEGRNLGELKSYVLLQVLIMKYGEEIYVFCSHDKNARNGAVGIGGVRCISVLSAFIRLKNEVGFSREEADPYIKSYMEGCLGKNQNTFKVQDKSKEKRMRKVPCEQVFCEMFEGKIQEMKNGNLKYV